MVGCHLEARGVVDDWSAGLRRPDDEEVLRVLRLRTQTGPPAGDVGFVSRPGRFFG